MVGEEGETGRMDRKGLTPLSIQLSAQQCGGNEARVPLEFTQSPLTVDHTQGKEGGEGCLYWDELHIKHLTSCCLSFLSLNLSLTPSRRPSFFSLSPRLSIVVLPPGGMGKHGALDRLLRCLLRHLAHHPYCS